LKELKIFPIRTNATPVDDNVIINRAPSMFDECDHVSISVAFSYHKKIAEDLYQAWKYVAHCEVGGPAYNFPGGEFEVGKFLKEGYLITSRGCNNHCWFCSVPSREGCLRELKIGKGHIILDDNFLACSKVHRNAVYKMLSQQKSSIRFAGGLEARLLTLWDAEWLYKLKCNSIYFAYDPGDALDELVYAMSLMLKVGFTKASHRIFCYVLIGFPGDVLSRAYARIKKVWDIGYMPMSMLYRNDGGIVSPEFVRFNSLFANKYICPVILKN
jgi:hypothetical protein